MKKETVWMSDDGRISLTPMDDGSFDVEVTSNMVMLSYPQDGPVGIQLSNAQIHDLYDMIGDALGLSTPTNDRTLHQGTSEGS